MPNRESIAVVTDVIADVMHERRIHWNIELHEGHDLASTLPQPVRRHKQGAKFFCQDNDDASRQEAAKGNVRSRVLK